MPSSRREPRVATLMRAQGFAPSVHPAAEAAALHARWRAVFAAAVFARTGARVHLGYDWHAFSYGFTPSLAGEAALDAFRRAPPGLLHVLPSDDDDEAPCFRVEAAAALPVLTGLDVSVVPQDFSFTMAFTHEDGCLGPYFARAPR